MPFKDPNSPEAKASLARRQRTWKRKRRRILLDYLGGKCVRCGFDDWRALQVDHVEGGGAAERRERKDKTPDLEQVRKHPERYQLLCANCNWIKRYENDECRSGPRPWV